MKCVVFYETWQMECCGSGFSTGDKVKWIVYENNEEKTDIPSEIVKIDYHYEAHTPYCERLLTLEGKVEEIKILYEKNRCYEMEEDCFEGELVETEHVGGFEKVFNNMRASGYVVILNDFTIRPAKEEEVTFKDKYITVNLEDFPDDEELLEFKLEDLEGLFFDEFDEETYLEDKIDSEFTNNSKEN